MRRFSLPILMLALALELLIHPLNIFGQGFRNPIKQARRQQKIQQGERPIDRRGQNLPPGVRKRPFGGIPGTEPNAANKNLNPQQRFIRQQLMGALALTPDQRQRINGIHNSHQDEAIAVGQRLRQARQKLDRALWTENYNEAQVKQLSEELAQAQADQIRLQFRVNSEIRNIITNEQIRRFRQKERELQILRRNQMRRQLEETDDPPPPTTKPPGEGDEDELLIWVTGERN
jgi:Spy/CpxP family protein refolding chaperone